MNPTIMTRRSFSVLAAVAALSIPVGLSGCSAGNSSPEFDIKVTRTFTMGTWDNKQMLVLNAHVKNNGDMSTPAEMIGFSWTSATQDGKPLSLGYLSSDVPEAFPRSTNIAVGGEGEAQIVFELAGAGPVEVVIAPETIDGKSTVEVYRETLDIASIEKVESEATFDVKIDDVLVTDDGEGKNLVVLAMTFTNNADTPTAFSGAVKTNLYQNDIQLKESYLPSSHPAKDRDAESNSTTDVKKGASLSVQVAYELLDETTAVEINLVDWLSYDQRVVLEKTIEIAGATGGNSTASTKA